MFALCIWLVRENLFKEVRMCFLLKGHTHDDIDRLFKVIKDYIEARGAMTPQELGMLISSCMQNTDVQFIHSVSPCASIWHFPCIFLYIIISYRVLTWFSRYLISSRTWNPSCGPFRIILNSDRFHLWRIHPTTLYSEPRLREQMKVGWPLL